MPRRLQPGCAARDAQASYSIDFLLKLAKHGGRTGARRQTIDGIANLTTLIFSEDFLPQTALV